VRTFVATLTPSLQVTRLHRPAPAAAAAAAAGAAGAGITTRTLSMVMEHQQQTNWCWSAVATSVGLFFQTGDWTQCGTANGCLNLPGTDCCTDPGPCDVYGFLNQSLTFTKSFNTFFSGTASAADIQAEIGQNDPVCVRVAWNTDGAHFLSITGYSFPDSDPSQFTLYLEDSIYGNTTMLLTDFPADYHGGGTWTHTYLTQPQP
jgi:hypothetical protein